MRSQVIAKIMNQMAALEVACLRENPCMRGPADREELLLLLQGLRWEICVLRCLDTVITVDERIQVGDTAITVDERMQVGGTAITVVERIQVGETAITVVERVKVEDKRAIQLTMTHVKSHEVQTT